MLTQEQQRILTRVFARKEQNCPYCKLPLYLSDASIEANDGTLVDVWECMRDNRLFTVPAGCNVSVVQRLHIAIQANAVGQYGDNDIQEHCNTFHLHGGGYVFCHLCCKKIASGWEIGEGNSYMQVCTEHVNITYKKV